jgi:Transposase DDE domain
MLLTEAVDALQTFRGAAYRTLGQRKDTLFELLEAALVSPSRATTVQLSLTPLFRRRWASAPAALRAGSLDVAACRGLVQRWLPARTDRPVWAVDGTIWPRPAAHTSPARTWGHRVQPGRPQTGVVPAWEYQWLVAVPAPGTSWVLPLDVVRRAPTAGSPTTLAIGQLQAALAAQPAGAPRPLVTFDSQYDVVALARAGLPADLLVRLTPRRRFYRPAAPYPGRGTRVRKHGSVFRLTDPTTQGPPDQSAQATDTTHGRVRVDVWQHLHAQWATDVPLTLIRVHLTRLPRRPTPPAPLWLAWVGGTLPTDLLALWRAYQQRFTVEHGFRFLKQELGWTTVRPQDPAAADRWSWLLALALWELWWLRAVVADQRLPWERPLPPDRLPPGRVRRAALGILLALSTPARPPQPRGNSPGRVRGQRPGPRPRHPVVRRRPPRAA